MPVTKDPVLQMRLRRPSILDLDHSSSSSDRSLNLDDLDDNDVDNAGVQDPPGHQRPQLTSSSKLSASTSSQKSYSELEARSLLENIEQAMSSHREREQELNSSIVFQMDLATTGHSTGKNDFGTAVCMNKVHHICQERQQVLSSIAALGTRAASIKSKLREARRRAFIDADWGKLSTDDPFEVSIDLRTHESFTQEMIDEMLSSSQRHGSSSLLNMSLGDVPR